jgi:protoporphyrinogen oxidase
LKKIAILGAGPMGLAVAYQMILDGYQPVIFEADDRVGGMTACFDFSGLKIERYYHFHCISDAAFLQLLGELGLEDQMRWRETRMGYYFKKQLHEWGNPIALLKFPHLSLLAKIRYGLHAFLSTKRSNWNDLDKMRAIPWIKKWIGEEAYQALWNALFAYKFYDYSNDISAAWIWSRIRRIGRSRYNLMREKLGYLSGGSTTLLDALAARIIDGGGEIKLSAPVTKVCFENGAVSGVESQGEFYNFEKIISTIPLPFVPKIMPDLPADILMKYRSLKNVAVVCVIVKLARSISENFWLNVNDEEMDIPGIVEYSRLRPVSDHVVYVPFYMPGSHIKFQDADEIFAEKVKKYLSSIQKDLRAEDIIDVRVSRYRYAQPVCEIGHLQKLPPISGVIKNLWVADTSYYYPEDRGISESIEFGRKLAREAVL